MDRKGRRARSREGRKRRARGREERWKKSRRAEGTQEGKGILRGGG